MDGDDTYDTIHSYSQEWKSQVGSPHSSKISYTRRSIVPVSPLLSRHKACSATRTENNYFFRRDVSFYPPRLGQDWDGRLQTKDHVHLVWLQQNIQAETQYPLQPPAKRGRLFRIKIIFATFSCMMPNVLCKLLILFKYLRDWDWDMFYRSEMKKILFNSRDKRVWY